MEVKGHLSQLHYWNLQMSSTANKLLQALVWAQLAPSVSPPFLSVSLILPFIPPYLSPPFPFFVLLLHAWNFPFLISSLKHLLPLLTCASLSPPSYFSLSSLSSFFPPQVHHSSIIDIGKFSCKLHEAFFVVLNFHGCIPSAQFFFLLQLTITIWTSARACWIPDYRLPTTDTFIKLLGLPTRDNTSSRLSHTLIIVHVFGMPTKHKEKLNSFASKIVLQNRTAPQQQRLSSQVETRSLTLNLVFH